MERIGPVVFEIIDDKKYDRNSGENLSESPPNVMVYIGIPI